MDILLKLEGKRIHEVALDENRKKLRSRTTVPKGKLFNFDLKAEGRTWLILDPYGDELLSSEMSLRATGVESLSFCLAIDREDGVLYRAHFGQDKRTNYVRLSRMDLWLPKSYLGRLDELKSCKRPFYLTFTDRTFADFIEREIGYQDLHYRVVVDLDFRPLRLQVTGSHGGSHGYREVSNWRNIP